MVFGLAAACGSEACPAGERTSRRSKDLRRRALAREARRRKFSTRLPEEIMAREARQHKSGTVREARCGENLMRRAKRAEEKMWRRGQGEAGSLYSAAHPPTRCIRARASEEIGDPEWVADIWRWVCSTF